MNKTIVLMAVCLGVGSLMVRLLGQSPAADPSLPYVATIKTSFYNVDASGKETLRNENTRVRARDRHGRTLDGPGSDDPEQVKESVIFDKPAGKRYGVNHHRRVVRLLSQGSPMPAPDLSTLSAQQQQQAGMSSTAIRGIPCLRAPVRGAGPGGKVQEIGWSCVSYELGFLKVASETKVSYGGETLRIVSELVSIETGTDPNPEWFRVPAEYQTVQGKDN